MTKRKQISMLSVLALLVAACSTERTPIPVMDSAIVVTAPRSLGALEEARKIEADIEREMKIDSDRPFIALNRTRLHPLTPAPHIPQTGLIATTGGSSSDVNKSLLLRTTNSLRAYALIGGLREGVYVMWWVIYNNPQACSNPIPELEAKCGGGDGSDLELDDTSIYWATGAVVKSDGFGLFHSRTMIGAGLGVPDEQFIRGPGLTNPQRAEVHLEIGYVGPAADDIEGLSRQLATIPEECRRHLATAADRLADGACEYQHTAVHAVRTSPGL